MKTTRSLGILVALSAIGIAGCAAHMPPDELVSAREAYSRANRGPALQLDPADLHTAKKQLDVAEFSFREDGDTWNTRNQSYLALRRIEIAETRARTMQAEQARAQAVNGMHAEEKKTVALTSAELRRTKEQVATEQGKNVTQGAALQDEKTRRKEAEKAAAQARADLAKFATVTQETRGIVITLSGSVLFASAKSDLLPSAQLKLNEVAEALIKEDPLSKIVVEGHTDSQGGAEYNQGLSEKRAKAVRDYLVTRGIAADRITSQGFGPSQAVADNTSAEGRANNRRVQIVIVPVAK